MTMPQIAIARRLMRSNDPPHDSIHRNHSKASFNGFDEIAIMARLQMESRTMMRADASAHRELRHVGPRPSRTAAATAPLPFRPRLRDRAREHGCATR